MKHEDLICQNEITIRFSEVDSMGIVWHGNYVKYFEDGREAFGNKYGIGYLDFHRQGVLVPLVKMTMDYKRPLKYGDTIIVETRFVNCHAAKLQYDFTIYHAKTREVMATASSVQVFLGPDMELLLDFPPFFHEWKKKHGIYR
jgi:acyl-CoA thioester hydrolase